MTFLFRKFLTYFYVFRRFPKRIYVGLPDANGRKELLEKLLSQQNDPLNRRDIEYVARRTDNYSNYDLTQLAKEAAMGPLRGKKLFPC